MEGIPKGAYTKEFREEAVKLVTEGGLSVSELGVGCHCRNRRLEIERIRRLESEKVRRTEG